MLQVGEDRFAESVDECFESGGADEVLGEYTADPSALSPDEATRTLRIAETLRSVVASTNTPSKLVLESLCAHSEKRLGLLSFFFSFFAEEIR